MSATEPVDVGTFVYTLDSTDFTTTPAIPDSGDSYTIDFNSAKDFYVDPEAYGMGEDHFVKQ